MSGESTRWLYMARHAEPEADGAALTAAGARQAEHLGRRLAHLPLSHITHGPLPRAAETARVVADQLELPPSLSEVEAAGDYVPYVPRRAEVPHAWADAVLPPFADVTEEEASRGEALGSRAIDLLAGPATDGRERVEVVITHAFTIGWLVRHALDAPAWRWWPPIQCHAGLTVIRYELEGPPAVMVSNDVAHLPDDLRWTGFPDHLRL
ncbi:histidine phosphatase family protein [Nocardioides euryhalodurans]|uniref:Histidine phosphatase family protein n=1 Tax=Nocardioides euryhalodurans TaxID=2518370 RepID=A0A4P7GL30_9ACTN|nr:histidine phosphatase family protein [Nocardioides euryhalodurans]QBR92514.1 histidine phosphatase family protein [Nocardioides euryhalodurans]